tara:strand:- start:633 stop:1658 length:1026 start_codon:yes stop_codon:yes gene_type:complete
MILLHSNGSLIEEIEKDGYEVTSKILMSLEGSTNQAMAKSLGIFLSSFVDVLNQEKPTWTILAGDRGEQLAASIACSYSYIPCAHIQAGERSGNIDGVARHAIGKLVHLHFASNKDSADRLIRLGEQPFRVFNVGAPQIDEIKSETLPEINEIEEKLKIQIKNGYILVVQHPVTEETNLASNNTKILFDTLSKIPFKKVVILPNNDAGSYQVRNQILKSRSSDSYIFSNISRVLYLGLLKHSKAIVGNSSSGLLEAPTVAVPAINIGRRQKNRVQGTNVINCPYKSEEIEKAINIGISDSFKKKIINDKNPYGDGDSSEKIIRIILDTKIDDKILVKELTS